MYFIKNFRENWLNALYYIQKVISRVLKDLANINTIIKSDFLISTIFNNFYFHNRKLSFIDKKTLYSIFIFLFVKIMI